MTDEQLRLIGMRIPNACYVTTQAGLDLAALYNEVVRLRAYLGIASHEAEHLEAKANADFLTILVEADTTHDWKVRLNDVWLRRSERTVAYHRGLMRLKAKLEKAQGNNEEDHDGTRT